MAGRIPLLALSVCVCVGNPLAADVPLAGYSFDDSQIETGPDTFRVFQGSRGRVSLDSAMRYSGYYAVQVRDVADDHDSPELQGYFPARRSGKLTFHFAFLVVDPAQPLNIALAGPQGFSLKRDGISFWLSVRDGRLFHTTDSIPKPLFPLAPFAWYQVDVRYDIGQGRYDLRIADSGVTVLDLKNLANAANQPGSAVDKFSFTGDMGEDASDIVYFVDDVWIAADSGAAPAAFTAPGRRKLFIDRWADYQRWLGSKPRCLPASGLEDFGLSLATVRASAGEAAARVLSLAMLGQANDDPLPAELDAARSGIQHWHTGCRQLAEGQAGQALAHLDEAKRRLPASPLAYLSLAQALAALKRWGEVDAALAAIAETFGADPRYGVATGQIGFVRGYQRVLGEQYFFSLLWQQRHAEAMDYARSVADQSQQPKVRALWTERVGDAAFLAGWQDAATQAYKTSLALAGHSAGPLTKLADLAYLAGDAQQERRYREAVYGSLRQ